MNAIRTTILLASATLILAFAGLQASADPLPGSCAAPCTIDAASTGYTMPATVIASGTDVVWHSTDVAHVQRDTSIPAVGSPVACFSASSGSADSDPVTFTIDNGVLEATTGGVTKTCGNAVAAGGNFVLPYHCAIHPNMNGVLVVTPA
jgi:plastocyanin